MKFVFIICLIINIIYLGFEIDRETRIQVRAQQLPDIRQASELSVLTQEQRKQFKRMQPLSELDQPPMTIDNLTEQEGKNVMSDLITPNVAIEAVDSNSKLLQMLEIDTELHYQSSTENLSAVSCLTFGPFDESGSAEGLINWFKNSGYNYDERWTYENDKQLFWVYLAPVAERSQALATLEQLQNQGVEDFRLIRKGSFKNAISLGLFSSQARVNRRLSDLNSKGYRPVVVPYGNEDSKKILWLDTELPDAVIQNTANQTILATFNSIPKDCSEIDMAASKP